jgi:hypothetical protein
VFGMVVPEWADRAALQAVLPPSVRLQSATVDEPGTLMYLPLRHGAPALPLDHNELFDRRALLFLRRLRVVRVHDLRAGTPRSTVFECTPLLPASPKAEERHYPLAAPQPHGGSGDGPEGTVAGAALTLDGSSVAGEVGADLPGRLGHWRIHRRLITCRSAVPQVRL